MNAGIATAQIWPKDLLITDALQHRRGRPNAYDKAAAFRELSELLADEPHRVIRRFLEIVSALCNAGTAGISLLRPDQTGQMTFHWVAISGALAENEGQTTPRNFSVCGLCLDAGETILVSQPERVFKYFHKSQPSMVEGLIIPLYDNVREPLGTLWLAHHDSSHFSADDARIVEQLAIQLVLALKWMQMEDEQLSALTLIESYKLEQRTVTDDFAAEHGRYELSEKSAGELRQTLQFKDAAIREVDHRAKNTLQIAANLLAVQSRMASSKEIRTALQEAQRRLLVLARLHELLHITNDGEREIHMPKLLHSVGEALEQSFAEMLDRVCLKISTDPIDLAEADAIPIAMLANELITNAYKYAFPNSLCGEITLAFKHAPENSLVLQIADNGVGRPSNDDADGLGQKLIRSFAAHLKGELVFSTPSDGSGMTATLSLLQRAKPEEQAS